MGGTVSAEKAPPPPTVHLHPSISKTEPDYMTGKLSHDPQYGYEGKRRKERVMVATEAEMASANVPLKFRGYCAHKFIMFEKCKRDEFPFLLRCKHQRHELEECYHQDHLIRMKEFERERRLLHRKARKEAKAAKEAAAAED